MGDRPGRGRGGELQASGAARLDARRGSAGPAAEPEREFAVDDVVDARLEVGEDRRPLGRRQPAGCDLLVEIRLGGGDERLLEPRRGLAVRLRDLGERVAVLEARAELRLGDAEIVGCRCEVDEAVVATAMTEAGADPDQRDLTVCRSAA